MNDKDKPMSAAEAIQRIEDHIRVHRMGEWPHIRLGIALNEAIAALREKAARESTECDWCQGGAPLIVDTHGNCSAWIEDESRLVLHTIWTMAESRQINCCPMCGRRLAEDG